MSKSQHPSWLALAALTLIGLVPARAQTYTTSVAYTAANSGDTIYSYDWDGSNLYYATADSNDYFDGLYQYGTSTPVVPSQASTQTYAGASVVTIGSNVFYNTSDIYAYNPGTGTSTDVSSAPNYGLYGHNGSLYITGGAFGSASQIYESGLNANGSLTHNPPLALGAQVGYSGPLAFDGNGDLFYAPGSDSDSQNAQQIFEYTAAQVTAALNGTASLNAGDAHDTYDYSTTFGTTEAGATSMLINGDQLLLTLTNFGGPSDVLSLTLNANGTFDGDATLAYQTDDQLGELREHDGSTYVSDGANILKLTASPEPSTWVLLVAGAVGLLLLARSRRRCLPALAAVGLAVGSIPALAQAGPFSPAGGQAGSTGIAASDSAIVEWADGYTAFNPGPTDITNPTGAKASFGTPSNALGPSDATATNPYSVVSLGDGGSITLQFAQPIANGAGADFAVYENGFSQGGSTTAYYLELATVAVSSDGVNFFTFPSVSLTPTQTQVTGIGAGDTLDPTNLYNLAGSEIAGYGTPFNLDDLVGTPGLNLNDITDVRITDVIGNINTALGAGTYTTDDASNPIFGGKYGSTNHVINDPFKTDFSSGGFDLDAVAVLHTASSAPEPATWLLVLGTVTFGAALRSHRARA